MKRIEEYTYEISRCVRCGVCRSVCPTFGVIKREAASARGKVALADAYLKEEVKLTDTVLKHITECVLCGACRQSCPNDVPVPDIMMAMRAEAVRERGLPFLPSLIMKNLQKPDAMMGKALKAASLVQRLLFKRVPGESGLHRRFPLPLIQSERLVPPLAKRFFLDSVKGKPLSLWGSLIRIVGGGIVAYGFVTLFGIDGLQRNIIILSSTMPSAVINFVLSYRYKRDADLVASTIALSTLISIVTTPVVLTLLLYNR